MFEHTLWGIGLVIAVGLGWLLYWYLRRYERKIEEQRLQFDQIVRQMKEQVAALPLEAVKNQAEALLRSDWVLECEYATTPLPENLMHFPPIFRELARQYKRIVFVNGAELDLWRIQTRQWRNECYRIGQADEDATIELMICPDTETVYEIYWLEGDSPSRPKVEAYPTIYHWIVVDNRISQA